MIKEHNQSKKYLFERISLSHQLRKNIVDLLENNELMSVSSLAKKMQKEKTVISQHLNILIRGGYVDTKIINRTIHYFLVRKNS